MCWFWSIHIFGAPHPSATIFSEPPLRVYKNFRSPPSISSSPPCHIKWTFPNGLLDKNLLTYPPHILASKTYHCFDDLDLSASEEECSNSTLQSSKGPIAARDRGKTELSHFCLLNLIWNPIFKCQQSIRFLKKQTSSYSAGIDIVQKRQFFWLEKLAPEKWLTLLPRAIAFLPAS